MIAVNVILQVHTPRHKNLSGKESTIIVDSMDLIKVHNGLFDRNLSEERYNFT